MCISEINILWTEKRSRLGIFCKLTTCMCHLHQDLDLMISLVYTHKNLIIKMTIFMRVNRVNVALGCLMIWGTGSLLHVCIQYFYMYAYNIFLCMHTIFFLSMFIYFIGIFFKPKYTSKFFLFVFTDKFTDSCFEC